VGLCVNIFIHLVTELALINIHLLGCSGSPWGGTRDMPGYVLRTHSQVCAATIFRATTLLKNFRATNIKSSQSQIRKVLVQLVPMRIDLMTTENTLMSLGSHLWGWYILQIQFTEQAMTWEPVLFLLNIKLSSPFYSPFWLSTTSYISFAFACSRLYCLKSLSNNVSTNSRLRCVQLRLILSQNMIKGPSDSQKWRWNWDATASLGIFNTLIAYLGMWKDGGQGWFRSN